MNSLASGYAKSTRARRDRPARRTPAPVSEGRSVGRAPRAWLRTRRPVGGCRAARRGACGALGRHAGPCAPPARALPAWRRRPPERARYGDLDDIGLVVEETPDPRRAAVRRDRVRPGRHARGENPLLIRERSAGDPVDRSVYALPPPDVEPRFDHPVGDELHRLVKRHEAQLALGDRSQPSLGHASSPAGGYDLIASWCAQPPWRWLSAPRSEARAENARARWEMACFSAKVISAKVRPSPSSGTKTGS